MLASSRRRTCVQPLNLSEDGRLEIFFPNFGAHGSTKLSLGLSFTWAPSGNPTDYRANWSLNVHAQDPSSNAFIALV